MAFDKTTILEMLEGIDPNLRSRIVTSLTEGTSPEERERIIDRTATKKVSPYTSDKHIELMELALAEDEDLANALATWIKKPANQDWLEMVLEEDTLDPSSVVGGAQLAGDRGYFDTIRENPLGIQGIINALAGGAGLGGLPGMAAGGIMGLLRRGGGGLRDVDVAAGIAPPASELQTIPEMARGAMGGLDTLDRFVLGGPGGVPPGLGRRILGGLRGMIATPPEEIIPEDLQGIM